MGTKYSTNTISGYNASPPPDDGTTGDDNKVTWAKHKTKLGDPVKTLSEGINTDLVSHFDNGPITKSANFTTTAAEYNQIIECTNSITISLMDASTAGAGYFTTVSNAGSGIITVDTATPSDEIGGIAERHLQPGETETYVVNANTDGYIMISSGTRTKMFTGVITGQHTGIYVTRPTTSTLSVTASAVAVTQPTTAETILITGVSAEAIDVSGTGAGGLDTGSIAATTWYYVYVIFNGSSVDALASTNATTPTLPSGYEYQGLVGAFVTDGSSNIIDFVQYGREGYYVAPQVISSSLTNGSWTGVDVTNYFPANANKVKGVISFSGVTSNDEHSGLAMLSGGGGGSYAVGGYSGSADDFGSLFSTSGNGYHTHVIPYRQATDANIYYYLTSGPTADRLYAIGWEF